MGRNSLDLAVLGLLVGVDEHGSVGAASRAAGMAQPNASRALKHLERDLGMALLERRATGCDRPRGDPKQSCTIMPYSLSTALKYE